MATGDRRDPHSQGTPKAFPNKPLENECVSRFQKEAVATLIAWGKITSEGIVEEANGRPQNKALKELKNSHG
jgi:hypothetical protein